MADAIDGGDRFAYLDAITTFARDGIKDLPEVSNTEERQAFLKSVGDRLIDWNVALRLGNRYYDRFVALSRLDVSRERLEGFNKLYAEIRSMGNREKENPNTFADVLTNKRPQEAIASRIGEMLLARWISAPISIDFCPFRRDLETQMAKTAFALAGYRADHGRYPSQLAALTPKYLAKIPGDTFRTHSPPIHYRLEGNAYLLWSVGLNGIDDGGRNCVDEEDVKDFSDDWIFRPVPLKTANK